VNSDESFVFILSYGTAALKFTTTSR